MSTAKKILIAVIVVIILAVIGVAVWYYFTSGKTSPKTGQSATATEASAQTAGDTQSAGSATEAGTPAPGDTQPAGSQSEVSGTSAGTAPAVISTGTEYWFTPLEKIWTGHKMEIVVVSGLLIALFVMIAVIVSIVTGRSSSKNR